MSGKEISTRWLSWFLIVNLKQAKDTEQEGASSKKAPLSDWPVGKSEGGVFLVSD